MVKVYKLMADLLHVCDVYKTESNEFIVKLASSDINIFRTPFYTKRDDDVVANNAEFVEWLEDRTIPKTRCDIDAVIKRMGLSRYDLFDITNITHAALMEDPYWLKLKEEDDFYKISPRGISYIKGIFPEEEIIK